VLPGNALPTQMRRSDVCGAFVVAKIREAIHSALHRFDAPFWVAEPVQHNNQAVGLSVRRAAYLEVC